MNYCDICGKDNARQWLADDVLWDMLAAGKTQVCSDCFDSLAEKKGVILFWSVRISKHSLEENPMLKPAHQSLRDVPREKMSEFEKKYPR